MKPQKTISSAKNVFTTIRDCSIKRRNKPLRDFLRIRKALKAATSTKEKIMAGRLRLGKGLLRSKTFWVNLLTGAAVALGAASGISFVPAAAVPWIGAGLAIVNILLRTVTSEPITSVK